jgi:hypothetical protein
MQQWTLHPTHDGLCFGEYRLPTLCRLGVYVAQITPPPLSVSPRLSVIGLDGVRKAHVSSHIPTCLVQVSVSVSGSD